MKEPQLQIPAGINIISGFKTFFGIAVLFQIIFGHFFMGSIGNLPFYASVLTAILGCFFVFYIINTFYLRRLSQAARRQSIILDCAFIMIIVFYLFFTRMIYIAVPLLVLSGISIYYFNQIVIREFYINQTRDGLRGNTIKIVIALIVAACIFLIWVLWSAEQTKKDIFKAYVINPIPPSVKIISEKHYFWLGNNVNLVFKVNQENFQVIVQGYKLSDKCAQNIPQNDLPKQASDMQCYFRKGIPNCKYCNDYLYLLWDQQDSMAYFRGFKD